MAYNVITAERYIKTISSVELINEILSFYLWHIYETNLLSNKVTKGQAKFINFSYIT